MSPFSKISVAIVLLLAIESSQDHLPKNLKTKTGVVVSMSTIRRRSLNTEDKAPEFRSIFHAQSLRPGYHLNLRCAASGSPMPQIRWYLYQKSMVDIGQRKRHWIGDYVDAQGMIISHFNITSVSTEDGGVYTCEAININGIKRHSAMIQIYGSPVVHAMDNVSIISTGRLQVDCPVSGFPIDDIRWSKDGKELPTTRRLKSFPNGTLTVIDARLDDEGWYRCDAKNKDGQLATGSLYIDVVEKPSLNPFLFGSDLREGMRTSVLCSALSGESPLTFTWFKDNLPVQTAHSDAVTVRLNEFTSTLTLPNIGRQHTGNYTCQVSPANNPQALASFTAHMVVLASPKWVLKPNEHYAVLRGQRVIIYCQAEGIPPPIHQWKKRLIGQSNELPMSGIVSGPRIHVLENGSLAIVADFGASRFWRICLRNHVLQRSGCSNGFPLLPSLDIIITSNNGVGNAISARTQLQVNTAAHFAKNFLLVKIQRGQSAELLCDAMGDAPLTVDWSRERDPLPGDKYIRDDSIGEGSLLSRIFLRSADISDSGFYTCTAANTFGSDEKKFQLVVQGPPDSPYDVKATELKNRWVTITWLEPRNGNSPLQGYIVEFTESNATWTRGLESIRTGPEEIEAKLIGLLPDTRYKVRVIAQNQFGNSQPSSDYMFKTDMEAPSEVPTNVRAEPKSAATIKITWKAPTYMKVPQKVDGYYVGYREQRNGMVSVQHPSLSSSAVSLTSDASNVRSEGGYTFKAVEVPEWDKYNNKLDELELTLQNLKRNTRYAIIVQAFNKKGSGPRSEEVIAQTFEFDPPPAVTVRVLSSTSSSITIAWESNNDERTPIGGYVISVKSENSDWAEHNIAGYHSTYVVDNLSCGTRYYISVCPFNKAGRAQASSPLQASTTGTAPRVPALNALLGSNSTFAMLRLNSWLEQQCPISYFVVQYKIRALSDWIMLSNNIIPEQGQIIITDLIPATWYDIIMIANSEAGQSKAQYIFSTLTTDGATISPPSAMVDKSWNDMLSNPLVMMPVLCTAVVALVIVIVVVVLVAHRNCSDDMMEYPHQGGGPQCHELHYSSDSTHKCDNMTLSSMKDDAPIECYPLAYATGQLEQKLNGHTPTVHTLYGLSLDSIPNTFRASTSDHAHQYEVSQRRALDDETLNLIHQN